MTYLGQRWEGTFFVPSRRQIEGDAMTNGSKFRDHIVETLGCDPIGLLAGSGGCNAEAKPKPADMPVDVDESKEF